LDPARSGRCAFEQQLTPLHEGPAGGTDIAALVGFGARTLADYLTKLLRTLFAVRPAATAPNADPRVEISLGCEFPLFGQVALADLASGLAGEFLAFAAGEPRRSRAGRNVDRAPLTDRFP